MKVNGKQFQTIWIDQSNPQVIQIIDQRHLPHQFIIEDLLTLDDFAEAIRDMHVRGAGLIGATAGFAMYSAMLSAPSEGTDRYIQQAANKLIETRPTAKNLAWAVQRQLTAIGKGQDIKEKQQLALQTAKDISDEDADFCQRIGKHGFEIIKKIAEKKNDGVVNILTHCNAGWLAFVDYGSATAPIYEAHKNGIGVHVWVDETRPWLQGSRLTTWELKEEGVPHTLICDNTGGHLMQNNMVDLVIVGTDRTTRSGDVANKIGTYLKALAAKDNNIPFYVALPSSTFDWQMREGVGKIPIEERADDEVIYVNGLNSKGDLDRVLIAPKNTKASNYSFDVTPAHLITGLITERGITQANEDAIISLFPEQKGI